MLIWYHNRICGVSSFHRQFTKVRSWRGLLIENSKRDGIIYVYAPAKVPRKIVPFSYFHTRDDMRKVLILGETNAAFAATSTLREMTYTGSISLVLPKGYLPYDENLLTKKIKDTKPEDFYFRQENWYEECGIDLIKNEDPVQYNKKY